MIISDSGSTSPAAIEESTTMVTQSAHSYLQSYQSLEFHLEIVDAQALHIGILHAVW
jgi:hypothetical protein